MFLKKSFCCYGFLLLLFFIGSFFVLEKIIFAQTDSLQNKILISEIKTGGEQVGDEFIELYNPNGYAVNLKRWSVKKKTKAGTEEYSLLSDAGTAVDPATGVRADSDVGLEIPPGGYFLIAPRYVCGAAKDTKCYMGEAMPDNFYSVKGESLADDNSVALYDSEKVLADKVGWGAAADFLGSAFAGNISAGKSLERKIVAGTMQDTGDNSRDFSLQDTPSPRNSKNSSETTVSEETGNDGSGTENADENIEQTETEDTTTEETETESADETTETANKSSDNSSSPNQTSDDASSVATAVEKKIVVSELLISPEGDDAKTEFIEIHNAGGNEVDLGGWSLEDQAGKTGKYIFPAGTKIKAGEYRAFYSDKTKLSLNNAGDGATLKDAAGKLIFKTPLSSAAKENISFALEKEKWLWTSLPTPGSKNIIKEIEEDKKEEVKENEKAKSVDDETAASESEEETAGGDDNVADKNSSSDKDLDFADGVNINEIFPDPAGRDNKEDNFEWVELFNENERDVNLKGWCLDDVLGKGSKAFCFAGDKIIAAKSYLVVGSEETKIAFNNSEEEVNLLWPDKMVVDSVSYQKSKEGFSYSLGTDGSWTWTQEATPSASNAKPKSTAKKAAAASSKYSLTSVGGGEKEEDQGEVLGDAAVAKEQYVAVSIAEVKALPLGSLVQLSGLVSAPHGILGKDILYIWEKDSGEGIQIFGTGNDLSSLLLGDEVKIYGRLAEVGGEKRLLAAAAEKISGDNLLESFTLDFANLESELGGLAATEGEVGSIIDANTFLLKTAGGEVKIYAEPETGISFADLKSGERMAVTGIFSRTSLGYRLLPRFKSDVRFLKKEDSDIIVKSDETAVKNNDFAAYLKFALLAVVLVVAVKKSAFYAGNRKRA